VQVNVRVAAGELGVGCVIRLTEYTINMVNGAARPLVLGAPHGSHLTHPVRQVFCTAGSVCQSPCGTAAGDRSNHACSIGMRADSGPVAPRWGPASQRRRGLAATSRSPARRLRGAGQAGGRRLRRRGRARGHAGRRSRRAHGRAGRRGRRAGGRGAHAGARPGQGEQGQDGQRQGGAWCGRQRRRQCAEDARGGQARRAAGGRADARRHAVALHAVRALEPRHRRGLRGEKTDPLQHLLTRTCTDPLQGRRGQRRAARGAAHPRSEPIQQRLDDQGARGQQGPDAHLREERRQHVAVLCGARRRAGAAARRPAADAGAGAPRRPARLQRSPPHRLPRRVKPYACDTRRLWRTCRHPLVGGFLCYKPLRAVHFARLQSGPAFTAPHGPKPPGARHAWWRARMPGPAR